MIIYPAIDLQNGQCVRLVQGRKEDRTVYSAAPGEVAASFQEQGAEWLHVVDLDGAFAGKPGNTDAIKDIASSIDIPFQVGGGLRQKSDVERLLNLGARRVIIGTKAVTSPDFVSDLIETFGADHIVLGLDARDGMVAIAGWVEKTSVKALELGKTMRQLGLKCAVYTDVSRDGLLKGPNLLSIEEMARESGLSIIASGGVTSLENIAALKELEPLGVSGAIIGKALYEGRLNLSEAIKQGK